MRKKTKKDYNNLVKNRNIIWDCNRLPCDVKAPTWWKCKKCGYRWLSRYNDIQQNHGCPACYGNVKKTKKDYKTVGMNRKKGKNVVLWDTNILPKNSKIYTWWKCKKCGHRWKTSYEKIKQGSNCRSCSIARRRNTKNDYLNIGKNSGIVWDDDSVPRTVGDATWWKCKKGHRWKTTYDTIRGGYGCPTCKDMVNGVPVSKPQRQLNMLLYGSLNYPEGRYRIDVAIMRNSQKIAVEYDCCYWHKGNEKHDAKRDEFLISNGWKIIHIRSRNLLPFRKQIKQAINQLNNSNTVNIILDDWKL